MDSSENRQNRMLAHEWITKVLLGVASFFLIADYNAGVATADAAAEIQIQNARMEARMQNYEIRVLSIERKLEELDERQRELIENLKSK